MEHTGNTPREVSRRAFLKGTAVSAAGFMIVPRHVLGGPGFIAPSDKVNIGVVGVGGRGKENTGDLLQLPDVQVIAIADPAEHWDLNRFYYKTEAGRGPVKKMIESHYQAKTPKFKLAEYVDFRTMLEKERNLDAVLCATPDHTHAFVSLQAMRAGKHVYCEKPLTHNIWEAREVARVARESKLATQMGNQLHSTEKIRRTVEYLRAGAIGKVREVHAWASASRWHQGLAGLPSGASEVPKGLNWDLWLGPRESLPFHTDYAPVTWRDFWAFGCGALGDFGCHDLDAVTWGLDLPVPETVQVLPAGQSNADITPHGEVGYYAFPARGEQPAVRMTWYSSGLRPPVPEMAPQGFAFPGRGTMFVGDKGILLHDWSKDNPKLLPESLEASTTPPPTVLPRSNGHHRDWVDAIKGGPAASSNFEYGARLTEITLLGVLSLRLGGKRIQWDAQNMKAVGLPAADEFIKEPVRKGWEMA